MGWTFWLYIDQKSQVCRSREIEKIHKQVKTVWTLTQTFTWTFLPASWAGGTAAEGHLFSSHRNPETSQVQQISDHLTLDGNIQGRAGMEAGGETEQVNVLCVCARVHVCVSVTWVICWPPGSRVSGSHLAWYQSRKAHDNCTRF